MAKGKVTINEVICKGCGLCVSVCPKKVLELSKTKIILAGYNPAEMVSDDCIACTICAKMCPDCAIVVEKLD
jgi:2-oxoglutarate ferredoxin oxidoreductase subunit delta